MQEQVAQNIQEGAAAEAAAPTFYDGCFRQRRRHGKTRVVMPPTPRLEYPVADTHAHLDNFENPALQLARCAINGVRFITAITDPAEENFERTFEELDLWQEQAHDMLDEVLKETKQVYAQDSRPEIVEQSQFVKAGPIPKVRIAIGCHPHNARYFDVDMQESLYKHLADHRVCAIGEVGLDYHYDNSPRDIQRDVFRKQIQMSWETGIPLALHLRSAHDEAYDLLQEEGFPSAGTLIHCFALGKEKAERWLEAGCSLALGGAVTFKRFDPLRETAAYIPLSQLVFETDSPFMTPEPMRGTDCTPAHVIYTAETIARARLCNPGCEREAFLKAIYENSCAFMDRPPTQWQKAASEAK